MKIADFGVSRHKASSNDNGTEQMTLTGTPKWTAPEASWPPPFRYPADVNMDTTMSTLC